MNDIRKYINLIIDNNRILRSLPAEAKDEVFRALEEDAFEIQYLKHEWEESDGKLDALRGDYADAREEIAELKKELEQLRAERTDAEKRAVRMIAIYRTSRAEVDELKAEIAELKGERAEIEE
jgi:chromosome segregation ATPase